MQLLAGIQKYFKCTSIFKCRFSKKFSNVLIFTYVIADILLYPKSLGSTQTVEFSRRTSSQSAMRHKNMISAHRNMFSVLCEIGLIYLLSFSLSIGFGFLTFGLLITPPIIAAVGVKWAMTIGKCHKRSVSGYLLPCRNMVIVLDVSDFRSGRSL